MKTLVFGCKNSCIPDSVMKIMMNAFKDCSGLAFIEIPNSVTEIGEEAFRGCTGLTSIEIPDSVTEIGLQAFYYCTGLKQVILNINKKKPSESESFLNRVLEAFDPHINLTVHIPIGTGYAYRHYPGFDQERLTFVPCKQNK